MDLGVDIHKRSVDMDFTAAIPKRLVSLDPLPKLVRERRRAESHAPLGAISRRDLGELSVAAKSLGLRHGVAAYAMATVPLASGQAVKLSQALDARLRTAEDEISITGDDVALMQVWTDTFAEICLQARQASLEWGQLLSRVYQFYTDQASALRSTRVVRPLAETPVPNSSDADEQSMAALRTATERLVRRRPAGVGGGTPEDDVSLETQAALDRLVQAWGPRKAGLHIASLFGRLPPEDRFRALEKMVNGLSTEERGRALDLMHTRGAYRN